MGSMEGYIRDATQALSEKDWHIVEVREMFGSQWHRFNNKWRVCRVGNGWESVVAKDQYDCAKGLLYQLPSRNTATQ